MTEPDEPVDEPVDWTQAVSRVPLYELDDQGAPPAAPDELDELAGDQLVAASQQLRTVGDVVSSPAGSWNPTPIVSVDGVEVARGLVAGALPGQVVVDGLSVDWGRSDLLSQPDLATGRLSLFDSTKTWATSRDLVGRVVVLSYEATTPASPSVPVRVAFFRGRIATCKVRRRTVQLGAVKVAGSLVELTLRSILQDLANIKPAAAWPNETLELRRARIAALIPSAVASSVDVRDFWQAPDVAPVAVNEQQSLLDHLLDLFSSCGADRMTYDPDTRAIGYLDRRQYAGVGSAHLWWNVAGSGVYPTARDSKGVYARSLVFSTGSPTVRQPTNCYLDAAALQIDDSAGLQRGPAQKITRVSITHKWNAATPAYSQRTVELTTGVDETVNGVRTASLSSLVSFSDWVDIAANDLRTQALQEATMWDVPDVSLRAVGGFEEPNIGQLLLAGCETGSIVHLGRSWLPEYGIRPTFAVIGGRIGYRNKAWECDATLSPIWLAEKQHAITWEEIDDGSTGLEVQWWDGDHPRGMHPSLTLDDLGYVTRGLGAAQGPDWGYDA